MRVGIFGGTFNPPHLAHWTVARQASAQLSLDRVLWVPAGRSPHKSDVDDPSPAHRLAMVSLAVADEDRFVPSDIELQRPPPSFTVDTLYALRKRRPDWELVLLVGQDSWEAMDSWRDPDEIRRLATVAVYPRLSPSGDGGLLWEAPTGSPTLIQAPLTGISSSEIRARVAAGRSIDGLVLPRIQAYIVKHGLYRPRP